MFKFNVPTFDWISTAPFAILGTVGMIALILEMIAPKKNNNAIVAVCGLGLVSALLVNFLEVTRETSFNNMLQRDPLSSMLNGVILVGTLLCLLISEGYLREKKVPFGEFYPLMIWSALGAMVMASSKNLVVLFLGLELLSISLYVMAGLSRKEERSEESAMKYFLLGAFATGFSLYGIAFTYGALGTLNLDDVGMRSGRTLAQTPGLVYFGFGLILIGLGFKCSFVPFHQWTPDVYQGAPTNVTAFMAAVSKVGAFAALYRILEGFAPIANAYLPALTVIAILTMTVGNLAALAQKDVKRILAYSSISHAGYILVALVSRFAASGKTNFATVPYYLLSYTLMTIGAFAVLTFVARNGQEDTSLDNLRGLRKRSPMAALALCIFMFSLIGMPPTAGFVGKAMIFMDAVHSGQILLAIVLAINSIISIYYYLGIVIAAVVSDGEPKTADRLSPGIVGAALVCGVGVFAAALFSSPLANFINR